jgi:DNA polymerase-3 subunit delta
MPCGYAAIDCRIIIEPAICAAPRLFAPSARRRTAASSPATSTTSAIWSGWSTTKCATQLTIAPDARAALVSLIGGDRQASRSEIRKLALYAHGKNRVELDDVLAVVADASALALDGVVDAAFAGRTSDAEAQFSKALAAGTSAGTILFSALRHVTQLHKARLALDSGDGADAALSAFIPPLHFRRKPLVETALRSWTAPRLEQLMDQLAKAALEVRCLRAPIDTLADPIAQRALLAIAVSARRKAQ